MGFSIPSPSDLFHLASHSPTLADISFLFSLASLPLGKTHYYHDELVISNSPSLCIVLLPLLPNLTEFVLKTSGNSTYLANSERCHSSRLQHVGM
jgi:hypothetical protein